VAPWTQVGTLHFSYSLKDKWNEDFGEELGVAHINTVIRILRKKFLGTSCELSIPELI
jgi:hypothetical protein